MDLFSQYAGQLLGFALLQILAVISPGPDFAIIVKNSLVYSRRSALITVLGVSLGILVHIIYISLGLGIIIKNSPLLFQAIKYAGGIYLIYLGLKGIRTQKTAFDFTNHQAKKDLTPFAAFSMGFITNVLNPKAILYFLSVFTVFLAPHTPTAILMAYGFIIFSSTFIWFGLVALCFSAKKLRDRFTASKHWIERITGILLILIGLKISVLL